MAIIRADNDRVSLSGEHYIHVTFTIPINKTIILENELYRIEMKRKVRW